MTRIRIILLFALCCYASGMTQAYSKKQPTVKQLNEQIAKEEAEIKRNEALPNIVKMQTSTTQVELKLVRSRITIRQKLIE